MADESAFPTVSPRPMDRLFPEFLEEVAGEDALAWVRERNRWAEDALAEPNSDEGIPTLRELEDSILEVLDDPGRIPMVTVRGDVAYNFWTDGDHPRGLWRRQDLSDYLADGDNWEVLINVDSLSEQEGKSWVWHGADVRYPEYDRALITLSDGGSDADETREFDMTTLSWVEGGFFRPEAKGSLSWIDLDHCWLTQPGPDSSSSSGYPLEARILRRGQALSEAKLVFAADREFMGTWASQVRDRSGIRQLISVSEDFYTSDLYLIDGGLDAALETKPIRLPVPRSAEAVPWNEWVLVWLRDPWNRVDLGESWSAGSLVVLNLKSLMEDPDRASATALFEPTGSEVFIDLTTTATRISVTTIRDVVSRVTVLEPPKDDSDGEWSRKPLALPPVEDQYLTASVGAVTPLENDRLWVVTSGYTQPSTLWLVDPDEGAVWTPVRQAPQLFDCSGVAVSQHFAVSQDGTRIPYIQVVKDDVTGPTPTLLYGYGGFNVSLTPGYNPVAGRAWIEHGGAYVVANIRGGGEYGPTWHQAALRENRHRAYEDFAAVAQDLVARGVTTPDQLGAQGGSNGGLLMGNMYTQYPEAFGAILCEVPLLDMGRYHTLLAGASWIAEYGDPDDTDDWKFVQTFSPVHLFDAKRDYPSLMIMTSTKDDRVHPAHARALAYLAEEGGKPILYFENIEGGHAGAADNRQRAHNRALGWKFLWDTLSVDSL